MICLEPTLCAALLASWSLGATRNFSGVIVLVAVDVGFLTTGDAFIAGIIINATSSAIGSDVGAKTRVTVLRGVLHTAACQRYSGQRLHTLETNRVNEREEVEQVSLHGRCVPGSKLEQATFPEQLIGRIDHFLVSNHLIDLQQPLQALLQAEEKQ
ncbi:hypothetical protein INR49_031522 [Caranx melampygus]|nr:hypothetical protein INR49_031522 [Caranx melampygus]